MNYLTICTVFVCVAVVPVFGLKCYTCTNCAETPTNAMSCDSLAGLAGSDACGKTTASDGTVARACMSKAVCLGGLDECAEDSDKNSICCCTSDNCNSAFTFTITRVLLVIAPVMTAFSLIY